MAVTKDVIAGVRLGRATGLKRVKRAVQLVVDQVLNNEISMVGLTTIRDYDEYTFTHSVNVCIFSVALGKKLGFSKVQLYDLGMAALLHDVGKAQSPGRDPEQGRQAGRAGVEGHPAHPWFGALTLFGMRGYEEIPYRSILVAHEHHMKIGSHRLSQGRPAPDPGHFLADRLGGRRVRCGHHPAGVPDRADRAGPGAPGDVGEPQAGLRPGAGQGADQSDRRLPGGHLRHPGYASRWPSWRRQIRTASSSTARWCGIAVDADGGPVPLPGIR